MEEIDQNIEQTNQNIQTLNLITKGSLWLDTWVSLYEVKGGAAVLVCEVPQL